MAYFEEFVVGKVQCKLQRNDNTLFGVVTSHVQLTYLLITLCLLPFISHFLAKGVRFSFSISKFSFKVYGYRHEMLCYLRQSTLRM